MASEAAVKELKECWVCDPCWDIETSEGFDENRDELLAYRLEMEAKWEVEYQAELREYAMKVGLDANLKLAEHVRKLEERVESMETIYRVYVRTSLS